MTNDAPELLPCPFCGGRGIDNASAPLPYVYCEICDAHGPACDTLKAAFEWWNARADHALAERDARVKAEALREAAHLMPRHYGVWSSTGVHIGTWDDGAIAAKVLGEYPGGVMRDLIDMDAILALIPDQHKDDE